MPRAPTPLRVAEWRPVLTRLSVAGILCSVFQSGKCPPVRASIIFPLFPTAASFAASHEMQTRTFPALFKHRQNPSSGVAYLRISEKNLFSPEPRLWQRLSQIDLRNFFPLLSSFSGHSLVAETLPAA